MILDAESLRRIRGATRDTDPIVRWEAAQLLISARDPQAWRILFAMLQQDSDPEIRRNIVNLVTQKGDASVIPYLTRALMDTDPNVRIAVLDGLAKLGDHTAAEAISNAPHDSEENVRLKAIETLKILQQRRDTEAKAQQAAHEQKMREWEEQVRQRQQQTEQQNQ